jgi:Isoprenylcysteine carboxyl methyltransferase (ICMT) family
MILQKGRTGTDHAMPAIDAGRDTVGYAATGRRSIDWPGVIVTTLLVSYYLLFAYLHFNQWRVTGRPVGLGLMALETVTAVLFLVRRRSRGTSRSPLAWIATGIGAFGILAVRPGGDPAFGLGPVYLAVQVAGALGAMYCLLWLGRSFGLVAANRGVQDRGPYGLVRHPVYACYLLTTTAYLLENPTPYNAIVFAVVWAFQVIRMGEEEKYLSLDPEYVAYKGRVRHRLLPGIY